MPILPHPLLVIAYSDDARTALGKSLAALDVQYTAADSFVAAEEIALSGLFNGILVDLPSIVKAKDDEKLIACSLTGFYPTLRVRTMGGMMIPMTMPGEARQDSSVKDFISKSCYNFTPRRLRASKRKDVFLSTICHVGTAGERGFTLNLSWGGAFIADSHPEKYRIGDELPLAFHEIGTTVPVRVCWQQPWGEQKRPGIGVQFLDSAPALDDALLTLLNHSREHCKDRIVMR